MTAVGASVCSVPVGAYAALPVEFVYMTREIYNSALGLGILLTGSANRDDFPVILAKWVGEYTLTDAQLTDIIRTNEPNRTAYAGGAQSQSTILQLLVRKVPRFQK